MPMLNDLPSPIDDYTLAKQQYVERYAAPTVLNTYLGIGLLTISVAFLGHIAVDFASAKKARNPEPLIIRINEVGRPDAVPYRSFSYQPQDAEFRYFLTEFVHNYYGRVRATIRDVFPRSLYFLEGRLADVAMEEMNKHKTIETFLAGSADDVKIEVRNVSVEDLRQSPYKASVEFEKVFVSPIDRREIKRERYTFHCVFVVKQPVPNELIPVNPLGLTITYFREDQAFR